jgi:hypothetical protein
MHFWRARKRFLCGLNSFPCATTRTPVPAAVAHPQLRIGQYLGALKADGDTELAACNILFYPENLSQAPDSTTCPAGHFGRQLDDKPDPLFVPDRLITVEECAPGGEVFHQRGESGTLAPQRQEDVLLKGKPEASAALWIMH